MEQTIERPISFYELHLRQLYRLLGHEGHYTQCHCHDVQNDKLVSRELIHGEEEVIQWAAKNNGKGNVFLGRNPRASDGRVSIATCLSLDIDPARPKGTAATESQLEDTLCAARRVQQHFQYGVLATSGNGALLIFPLREPVDAERAKALGIALENVARQIIGEPLNGETKSVVDSTHDAARLVKAVGAISTKGDNALWRHARWLDSPSADFRNYDAFTQLLNVSGESHRLSGGYVPPDVEKGSLDRSKADISLANRLKLQGFTADDTYRALVANSFRPGREDDYKNIIEKVYFNRGDITTLVSGGAGRKELQLWTPSNGITEYIHRERHVIPELPTGFSALDAATHGLIRGHIFTVGARTNTGKTTFAVTVAQSLCRVPKRILFISTETQFHEIWDRYIAAATGIPAFKLQHGVMSVADRKHYEDFITQFKNQPFTVYDDSRPNIHIVRQAVEQAAPDVLIFDYFQHVEGRETKELEEFVMQVKELAKEKQIAVMMCAQLHDGYPDQKTGKVPPPTLASMKNCKVLNDESRVVLLLDWERDSARGDGPVSVKGILAKNKGVRTDVLLKLDRAIPRFLDEAL